jgi:hypothetical protein
VIAVDKLLRNWLWALWTRTCPKVAKTLVIQLEHKWLKRIAITEFATLTGEHTGFAKFLTLGDHLKTGQRSLPGHHNSFTALLAIWTSGFLSLPVDALNSIPTSGRA